MSESLGVEPAGCCLNSANRWLQSPPQGTNGSLFSSVHYRTAGPSFPPGRKLEREPSFGLTSFGGKANKQEIYANEQLGLRNLAPALACLWLRLQLVHQTLAPRISSQSCLNVCDLAPQSTPKLTKNGRQANTGALPSKSIRDASRHKHTRSCSHQSPIWPFRLLRGQRNRRQAMQRCDEVHGLD